MKETFALIFATLALSIACIGLLMQFGYIKTFENKIDKYEEYRNEKGLLGRKKK